MTQQKQSRVEKFRHELNRVFDDNLRTRVANIPDSLNWRIVLLLLSLLYKKSKLVNCKKITDVPVYAHFAGYRN